MSRSISTSIFLATLALGLAACGSSTPTTTTTTAPDAPRTTETFTGTLLARSSMWHPFTVTAAGPLEVTLTKTDPLPSIVVGLGVGQVLTTGCGLITYNSAAAAGAVISGTIQPGSFCVSLYDVGTVTDPVNYTVTVTHP